MTDLRDVAIRLAFSSARNLHVERESRGIAPKTDAETHLTEKHIEQAILEGMKAALGPADDGMAKAIMDSGKNPNTSWSSAIHDTWNAMAEVRLKSLDADETVRRGE